MIALLEMLVREGIEIRKSGRVYKALCPFHSEKTPSFVIWPDSGRYKCFGCGVNGDAIQFLRNFKGLSFQEAAREAGLELTHNAKVDKEAFSKEASKKVLKKQFFRWLRVFENALCKAYRELTNPANVPDGDDFVSLANYYADYYLAVQKIEHLLDILQFGTLEEKYLLFKEKSVAEI